jgi:aldose 1-epimerase
MTYGGIIVSLRVPDRAGNLGDVVLGYESLAGYLNNPAYFGAIIGRYANRIAKGRFTLDATTYQLAANNGPNHLHGGIKGFDKVVWQAQPISSAGGEGVAFSHTSPDGDEGYPGTLAVHVHYRLTNRDELVVDYEATTDAPTPVNLTQHSYFNLAGAGSGDVRGHELMIAADLYTPVDAGLIPTGAIAPLAGTAFDFRIPRAIGDEDYDVNFVLRAGGGGEPGPVHAAHVAEPTTGRTLDVFTTEPGAQLYTGRRSGFCLETQHYPDSPNQPRFPSTILRPGQRYRSRTVFAFGVQR